MSAPTHTPGPWHSCCATTNAHYIFSEDCETTICQPRHNDPALDGYEPMEGTVTIEQRLANARLIAAAPDLLAALQLAIEAECGLADYEPEWEDAARAAITKATGKESA